MNETPFAARMAPRDLTDLLISVFIGAFQMAALFGLPGWITYYVTGSAGAAWSVAVLLYLVFGLCAVSELIINGEGIRFKRIMGGPRFIAWKDVRSVHEVPRRELIVHGWIWPFLPFREMAPTATSLGHFRIEFGDQWAYFPPRDAAAFTAAVKHFKARANC